MHRTPSELLATATAADLLLLRTYDVKYPIGDIRDDYRAGTIAATIANVHLKPGAEPLTPLDMIPFHKPPDVDPPVEVVAQKLFAWARSMGAEVPTRN